MQVLKNSTIIETIRLNRLRWFGHIQRMEENRIPKRVLYEGWNFNSGNYLFTTDTK